MDQNEQHNDPNSTMPWTPEFAAPEPTPSPKQATEREDDPQATVRFRPEWLDEKPSDDA